MRAALLLLLLLPVQDPSPRTPASMLGTRGASWLEREGREEEQRPEAIFAAMGLKEGDQVADLGCGTGWFARRMAPLVGPRGRVYAVDIQAGMLELARDYARKEGLSNILFVEDTATDPKLPPAALDWILLVDVYHEFEKPKDMLRGIRAALKPGGRVALVEYRLEDGTVHVRPEHRMSADQILAEWVPAGFKLVERLEFLPTQHFFIFEGAPEAAPPPSAR